jgi:hypothetical protein
MNIADSSSKTETFGGSDLLAELAGEATQKVKAIQSDEQTRQTRSQNLHEALARVFYFFNQFSNHLNKIEPTIARPYKVDDQAIYSDLRWNDASTVYRKQSLADNAFMDHVTFWVKLTAPGPVTVKRRWHEIDSLEKLLDSFGLSPLEDLHALVRKNPQQEFFHAGLAPDFLMRIQFQGNYSTGQIDLLCNNFDGFGIAAYTLNPEAVNQQLLDEIGRFLIGRKDSLPAILAGTRYQPKQPVYR